MEYRRIEADDYKDIFELNKKLGYSYDADKVYDRIISLLETGSDIISVADDNGSVVAYIHGSPYETLYSDKLFNVVAFVVKKDLDNRDQVAKELFDAFEKRVKKNGYAGIRIVANTERVHLYEFLTHNGFESHRDLKHYLKYFD